ncbi:Toxin co-regulated pilus biosynthesis protein Q [Roseateles sp. YR242]|uniref:toxin co-regulated pilus biosynthesis Q family protein n=1 Tax=Roseateles sp. YR242 TaxID=1855305 RepID=UPI0008ACA183|nr:toxin co-regulated pilus biosynthesis Q family protein [Roseateles sp. YR242]SEL08513.1 Toxin co-regulated pilus biosynthesis protein Q [Roseateles sp. YR242]
MNTLRLLPSLALVLAAGAQAAAPASSTSSSPSSTPLPAARAEIPGYGEVEWIRTPRAQPLLPGTEAGTEADALKAMRAEAPTEWTVELSDQSFRQTLLRWTRIANWQLVWEVDRDFAIDAQVTLNGNFLQALDQAMTALRDTDFPVQARINPDTRVVRVVRYMLDGERR